MISIDTNIIIRFLTKDDKQQFNKAFSIINANEVFIADTVILETEWVLRYAYNFSAEDICDALTALFGLKNIHLTNPSIIAQVIEWHRSGMDFSDALHLAHSQQFEKFYTFDKRFVGKANGVCGCEVVLG